MTFQAILGPTKTPRSSKSQLFHESNDNLIECLVELSRFGLEKALVNYDLPFFVACKRFDPAHIFDSFISFCR